MTTYTDEQKARMLREARNTLRDVLTTKGTAGAFQETDITQEAAPTIPVIDAGLEWRERQETRASEREQARKEFHQSTERRIQTELRSILEESFQTLLAEHHTYLVQELLPELIAEVRNDVSDEIERASKSAMADWAALRDASERALADLKALRAEVRKLSGMSGELTDIPAIPLRHPRPN